jgi:cytochrome c peroxidase
MAWLLAAGCWGEGDDPVLDQAESYGSLRNTRPFRNPSGKAATFSTTGKIPLDGEFFQEFGTNERTCGSCHLPSDGWTISAATVQDLFLRTEGLHPIFRPVDGSNSPAADVSTVEARRAAYSMLLSRGLIRIGIGISADAEFELIEIDDPYGFASASELSLFRRPLPASNLGNIPFVMWDGRETGPTLDAALATQANAATLGHAEATERLTDDVKEEIVAFESALSHAQLVDNAAGRLDRAGARGGPVFLAFQDPFVGRMDLFDAWAGADEPGSGSGVESLSVRRARAAIARGQALFNERGNRPFGATCSGCHAPLGDGPENGFNRFHDLRLSSPERRTPDLPLYTLRNKATGEIRSTTDPGRALITGLWVDIDHFKVPGLRGLAARAPYWHNGSSATLVDVVTFYEEFAGFDFTEQEEADLVAFLSAL